MNRFGSHWRWRVVLGAILVVLLLAARWRLRERGYRRLITGAGGPPILLKVERYLSYSVEAWDPSGGRHWVVYAHNLDHPFDDVPSFYGVQSGKGVAWIEKGSLHVVDVMPPHRRDTWRLPESLHKRSKLVGLSPNGKYGVFSKIPETVTTLPLNTVEMSVVDLQQERVVSREAIGDVRAHDSAGNFDFWDCWQGNPTKSFLYRYHLDDHGTWREVKVPDDTTAMLSSPLVGRLTPIGNLQLLDQTAGVALVRGSSWISSMRFSPTNNRYLAETRRELYLGDLDSSTPLELKPLLSGVTSFEFQRDGRDVAAVDHWGNVFQVDVETGQRIAVGGPGTREYRGIMATVVLLGITASVWGYVAISEQVLGWGLIDAMLISWIASAMAALAKITYLPFGPESFSLPTGHIASWMDAPLFGIGIASLYFVAWYWAYGNRHVLVRFVGGIIWLAAVVTPVVVMTRFLYRGDRIPIAGFWEPMIAQAVLVSGVVAFLFAASRWFGWRLQDRTRESEWTIPKLRRYGLASLFTIVTLFAIVLALCRAMDFRFDPLAGISLPAVAYFVCALSPSLGVGLPIAFTSRTRRQLVVSTLAIVVGTIVELFVSGGLWNNYTLAHLVARFSGALLAAILPCILLRMHGYHWQRASTVPTSQEQAATVP